MTRGKAKFLRNLIEQMAVTLNDETALTGVELFPMWGLKGYAVGDRVQYNGILYKCVQAHTAQADWTPDTATSLYKKIGITEDGTPEWVQPLGATDAYNKGDKVSHNNSIWVSDVDANVWEPGVHGWTKQ